MQLATTTTTDWISAIGGGSAALIALAALIATLSLIRKQSESLTTTVAALTDEMKWRRRSRVSKIRLQPLVKDKRNEDLAKLRTYFSKSGMDTTWKMCHVEVINDSDHHIKNVTMKPIEGAPPRCHIVDFDDRCGRDLIQALPPGAAVRFYWTKEEIRQDLVEVDFMDEEDGPWTLSHKHGLVDRSEPPNSK